MNKKQLELLACPQCQGKLEYVKANEQIICRACELAFPVKDGIPVMLLEEAQPLDKVS